MGLMNPEEKQRRLDELAELVSTQADFEARRRRLIHQLHVEGECSLSEIATAADLTRQGVRYLLLATAGTPELHHLALPTSQEADHA